MSTIDTSTWSPDADLNGSIEGIPLNADASIAQTWQALRILMAAVKGDGDAIRAIISVMEGATASADGTAGLVPQPLAGDQDKVLKGDGTWEELGVSSVSGLQTALDAKADDSATVHNTGNETVAGVKTFSSQIIVPNGLSSTIGVSGNTGRIVLTGGGSTSSASAGAKVYVCGAGYTAAPGHVALQAGNSSGNKQLVGMPNGTLTWDGNAIQVASDERLKTPLASVPDEVLDAWESVQWGQFQFLDAVSAKGESARQHLGLIAQRVKAVFEARGLDSCRYGVLCHEEREASEKEDAVDLWMVRYEEALAMEAVCQRRRADRLEARIAALEEALHELA